MTKFNEYFINFCLRNGGTEGGILKGMKNFVLALCIAAAAATFAYSKLGKRIGYGNQKHVWQVTAMTFAAVFVMAMIVFTLLFSI